MGDNDKSNGSDAKGGFWTTLPGILTGLSGLVVAITGLIAALSEVGLIKILSNPSSPSPTVISSPTSSPQPSTSETPFSLPYDPTKPFLIQLGSDTTPVSAGDEVDRIKQLAAQKNLRVDQFKKGNWYVTTVGFFSSRQEAESFRNLVIQKIPFFQSTDPQIQNLREWCPNYVAVGTHLECRN
ncbi:MAG: SPOR domain-containing protein [Pseudanabaenaceae cyanobacterium bins.39]|nr:SPOR domain-containing protein [Pseudanabaenaceae cyanobacterium bins.39]